MIRAGAGLEGFRLDAARELVQYSVRRGLISADEGEELMQEVTGAVKGRRARGKARKVAPARKGAKRPAKKPAKKEAAKKKPAKKTAGAKRVKKR